MPEPKLREVLARLAQELEDEEAKDEIQELRERKPTWDDFAQLLRDASPEQRAEIREILADADMETPAANGDEPPPKPKRQPKPKAEDAPPPDEDEPPKPKRNTRPGRRSGAAYDWYVDEESGKVVHSPVAVIYAGEDEPDEVEMLPAREDEEAPQEEE